MNGRQLADEATRRHPGLKVLYTTGYARNAIVHDGRLDPGVRLVTKPFTFAELSAAVADALRTARLGVLVVEDEMLLRMPAVALIEEMGCVPFEAGTAAEAKSMLRLRGHEIAVILVDLGLPDNEGDEIVVELRKGWPDLSVVVASGAGANPVRPELAADPKVSFLPKPYGPEQLAASLAKAGIPLA